MELKAREAFAISKAYYTSKQFLPELFIDIRKRAEQGFTWIYYSGKTYEGIFEYLTKLGYRCMYEYYDYTTSSPSPKGIIISWESPT